MSYYKHTFLNGDQELRDRGLSHLESVKENLDFWFEYGYDSESYDGDDQEVIDRFYDLGSFYEYGLCFDFVEATDTNNGYYRYQISWGGPSDEIRFHPDGQIEYVFLDWFVGVGFDVSNDDTFKQLKADFQDMESIDFSSKNYEELYAVNDSDEDSDNDE